MRSEASLEDIGLTVKTLDERRAIVVGSNAGLLDDAQAAAVQETLTDCRRRRGQPVFTYLANTLRRGDREIPYSLVTAIDLRAIAPAVPSTPDATPFPDRVERVGRHASCRRRSAIPSRWSITSGRSRASSRREPPSSASRPWCRSTPAIAISRRCTPASAIHHRLPIGIRRFRSICAAFARPTRRTGTTIGRHRRRSCRWRWASVSGGHGMAHSRPFAPRRPRVDPGSAGGP